jgi:Zn-dependent protease
MKQSFKLFNFKKAPVTLSIWFFLLFAMLPVNMVISIFISVLVHELAHAWVANRKGYQVYGINIDIFSGSASIDTNMHERDSIPIVAAGPISNIILAGIGFLSIYILPVDILTLSKYFITSFITVNIFLAVFNILPIFPMDGGRIVRDLLVLKMRDRRKARQIAAIISLVFSTLLLVYSIYTLSFILILFSGYFSYLALKDLGWIKDYRFPNI